MKKLFHYISVLTVLPFQLLIRLYQITISPDHSIFHHLFPGGFCRYTPSCSAYAHAALGKYGLIRGSLKAVWRILRCNPWSKGGVDLP